MKLLHQLSAYCLIGICIFSCSKTQVNDPVLPSPVDSSEIIEPPVDENPPPTTHQVEVINLPILNPKVADQIYLGAIIKGNDLNQLSEPVFTAINDTDRNKVAIYTDPFMDDFSLLDVMPSKKTDAILLDRIKEYFMQGSDQGVSLSTASPFEFGSRFNDLRDFLGYDEDVDKYFDLGFKDTTKLAENKGRVLMYYNVVKAHITMQPRIYDPFIRMEEGEERWQDLFGSEQPQIVSSINYGTRVLLLLESDASSAKLIKILNSLFAQPADDIIHGIAFNKLSAAERKILNEATAYGYSFGDGITLPHQSMDAIQAYVGHLEKISKSDNIGVPISYTLNQVTSYKTYISTFTITNYPQELKDK